MLSAALDFLLHIDMHLDAFCQAHGAWTYGLLFLIVFVETGVVVAPFLPGDSLLFAAGVLAGRASLDLATLLALLTVAPLLGDNCNYWLGRFLGPRVLKSETSRWLNRRHLAQTRAFFDRYGASAVIIARFVPIVRTCTPFVAGVGAMNYAKFLAFSAAGAVLWVGVCVLAGYFFGGYAFVKEHFSLVVLAIIFISVLPAIVQFIRLRSSPPTAPRDER